MCIHNIPSQMKYKVCSKSKALEPLALTSHALDVPAGTVRIYLLIYSTQWPQWVPLEPGLRWILHCFQYCFNDRSLGHCLSCPFWMKKNLKIHRLRIQATFVVRMLLFLGLKPASNESFLFVMLSIWRDLTVRERRPVVDTHTGTLEYWSQCRI